jgi:hypothetical protein
VIHIGGFAGCFPEALHPDQSLPGQLGQAEIHHAQADAQAPGHTPLGDVGMDIILVNGNVHKPNFIIYLMLKRNGFVLFSLYAIIEKGIHNSQGFFNNLSVL